MPEKILQLCAWLCLCLFLQGCNASLTVQLTSEYRAQPAAGASVQLIRGYKKIVQGKTNEFGTFTCSKLMSGKVALLIAHQDPNYLSIDTIFVQLGNNKTPIIDRWIYPSAEMECTIWLVEDSMYGSSLDPLNDKNLWGRDEYVQEEDAVFPGGMHNFHRFIADNIRMNAESLERDVVSKVLTEFIVEKDGSISHIALLSKNSPELAAEIRRLLRSMPAWIPAMRNGTKIRFRFRLPIRIVIQ